MAPYRQAPLARQDDDHARVLLARELDADETLRWAGRPQQGVFFEASDLFSLPFMVLWTAFACFWEHLALKSGVLLMELWGLPFIGFGLYNLIGRHLLDARRRRRIYYGITDRRALIVVDGSTRQLTSLDLTGTMEVQLDERRDGSGSIAFGSATTFGLGPNARTVPPPTFVRIGRVREAYLLAHEPRTRGLEPHPSPLDFK